MPKKYAQKLTKAITTGLLSLGLVVGASPVMAAVLTRQDFSGNWTLTSASISPILDYSPRLPIPYSGFVVYDENGNLQDWAVNIGELNPLFLEPDSTEVRLVTFESSSSTWNLGIDYQIPNQPFETLASTNLIWSAESGITFDTDISVGISLGYSDPNPNITTTVIDSGTPIPEPPNSTPEPSTVLMAIAFLAAMPILKKRYSG